MNPKYPFYCPDCGSYDRRNWSSGGCRYFDDKPAARRSGTDPPCALEEWTSRSDRRDRRSVVKAILFALITLSIVFALWALR
jgi:hypothetical protein